MSDLRAHFQLQRDGFAIDAAFSAPARGVTALFGPSGSGKTTVLRCLAGLEPGVRGHLQVGGETWLDSARGQHRPTHHRALGYVFQDARLFPHLSVQENLNYGQKRAARAGTRAQHGAAQDTVIDLLGLASHLERHPARLSGGEQQRVAIGRALLSQPRLLLLDEPLSALDAGRKNEILPYLDRLRDALAIPIIYVSHAIEEVSRLADHLLLIDKGTLHAQGPLTTLITQLESPLSHGEDAGAVIEARVSGHDTAYHLTSLTFPGGQLRVEHRALPIAAPVRVWIHARDVSLALSAPRDSSILNILEATIIAISQEDRARVTVRLALGPAESGPDETVLLARITRKSCEHLALVPGTRVYAQVKSVALSRY